MCRHIPKDIAVDLYFDGGYFRGVMEDFNTQYFRVRIRNGQAHNSRWIREDEPVHVALTDGENTVFTADCGIMRQIDSRRERSLVLSPALDGCHRLGRERFDGPHYALSPRPNIVLKHPVIKKSMVLEVAEVSRCWFSMLEHYVQASLLPGLVINNAVFEVHQGFSVQCKIQVCSGEVTEHMGKKFIKWTALILDMEMSDQAKFFGLLQRVADQKSYVCNKIDVDDLLRFFFDAGFVYPRKYKALQPHNDQFRETYRKLYLEDPPIARHFTQQDKGVVQAHVSMIRCYENTWMLHHHAAIGHSAAGLTVLEQVWDYVNDCRWFPASHMDFVIGYYRPNNKFPEKVFGGFSRALGDRKACSIDPLAYSNFRFDDHETLPDDGPWNLQSSTPEDLVELRNTYEYRSGGLLIDALDLGVDTLNTNDLSNEYRRLGFDRQRHLMSLKKDGVLKAVIMVMVSDIGLNMSNLTNCIHVFIVEPDTGNDISIDELYRHIAKLRSFYAEEEVPVLLYPLAYADSQMVSYEKIYNLMVLDTRYVGHFQEFKRRLLRRDRNNGDASKPLTWVQEMTA